MWDHEEIVRRVYSELRREIGDGEVIVRKNGHERRLGKILVLRKGYGKHEGRPDIVVKMIIKSESLRNLWLEGELPIMVEIEKDPVAAGEDFKELMKRRLVRIPAVVVTERVRKRRTTTSLDVLADLVITQSDYRDFLRDRS